MHLSALALRLQFAACPHIITADADYALPTLRWLRGPFYTWFKEERWSHNLDKWERRNDCDNFARAYAQGAQDCHALTTGSLHEGLAVGEFFYTRAAGGGHAIVCAFVEPSAPVFIEPQSNALITLTPAERASAFFVRF